jgi:hypothetical protein
MTVRKEGKGGSMKQGAAIVGSNLVALAETLSREDRQDVMDLLLYAELEANKKYDKNELAKSWMNHYQRTLVTHGCELKSFLNEEPIFVPSTNGLHGVALSLIGSEGSAQLERLARSAIEALKLDAFASEFYQGQAAAKNTLVFSITPCELTPTGEPAVFFCGLKLVSTIDVKGAWLWKTTFRDVSLFPAGGTFIFKREAYAKHRQRLRDEAALQSDRFIRNIGRPAGSR